MIPKSMSSTPIGDGYRFSDKIMRQQRAYFFGPLGPVPGAALRYSSLTFFAGFFFFAAETSLASVTLTPETGRAVSAAGVSRTATPRTRHKRMATSLIGPRLRIG